MANTPNYSWAYPTVNADLDTWGTTLNALAISIDAQVFTVAGVASGAATTASAALVKASNLSDLTNAATARNNLGLTNDASGRSAIGVGSNGVGNVTISTSAPSGTPANGDRWIQYIP